MSFNKSPFYIYPQVETAYDLNLSAALLRASCTTESEGTLLANANKFHKYLETDDADFWMDGLSLATLMNDSSLKAPNTKKTLRHISLTPIFARTSSFVANREGVWGATKRMALLARRSCKNENDYKALMNQLFNPSEDVWSRIIDLKIKIFSNSLPPKNLLPITGDSVNLEFEYKDHGFDTDPRLLKLLFPFTFTNDTIPSPSSKGLASLLDWRCRIPPQHFVALLDSYLRLVSFSEVFHLMVSCHTLVDLFKDASRGLHRDVSAALSSRNNKFRKLETGRDLKQICEKLVEHYISDSRLLDMFSDALVNKKIQFNLCTVAGLEALLLRLKDSVEIRDIFSSCTREHQALLPNEFANGIKRNLEFLNYSVRQRRKPNDISEQYDQGYWARTITRARNAPGIVMVSPVGATLFAGLASARRPGCTFNEFQRELLNHGLVVTDDYKDKIFNDLKLLGLANDNPDGDGGFLVRNPFYKF